MRTHFAIAIALALPLLGAPAAVAGPGSVPPHLQRDGLLRQRGEAPPYALTGEAGRDDDARGWHRRLQTIGGVRDSRVIYERGAADERDRD